MMTLPYESKFLFLLIEWERVCMHEQCSFMRISPEIRLLGSIRLKSPALVCKIVQQELFSPWAVNLLNINCSASLPVATRLQTVRKSEQKF